MPESRSDEVTTFRREIKFALPHVDFGKFRSILEVNCRRVSYEQPTSRVVSLYFDDVLLSSCHDNLDGTPRRSKLRLRIAKAAKGTSPTLVLGVQGRNT